MSPDSGRQRWANEIEHLLRDITKVLRRTGRASLGAFSITPPQFDALLLLKDHVELTIGDLSAKMYLAYSTTTDLVDRMERNQLVIRVRDLNDRRIVRLHMLDRGHQIIQEVMHARQSYLASVLEDLDDAKLEQWRQMLTALHSRIV